jgi:hypothetical protein
MCPVTRLAPQINEWWEKKEHDELENRKIIEDAIKNARGPITITEPPIDASLNFTFVDGKMKVSVGNGTNARGCDNTHTKPKIKTPVVSHHKPRVSITKGDCAMKLVCIDGKSIIGYNIEYNSKKYIAWHYQYKVYLFNDISQVFEYTCKVLNEDQVDQVSTKVMKTHLHGRSNLTMYEKKLLESIQSYAD